MEEFSKYGSASGQRQPQRRKRFDTPVVPLVVGIEQGQDRPRIYQTFSPHGVVAIGRAPVARLAVNGGDRRLG